MAEAKSFRQLLGVPPSTASPSDSALVIIDAQEEYRSGLLAVSNAPSSSAAIASLLDRYRAADAPLVHILHQVPEGAPVFTPGKPVAEEMDAVKAKSGEKVIHKQHPGSFAGTELQKWLDGQGVKKVVLAGYMVSFLVVVTEVGGWIGGS